MMSETQTNPLVDQTVILDLIFRCPTNHRPARSGNLETDADRRWISIQKKIIKSENYAAAKRTATQCIEWLRRMEIPSPFKRGMHLIPLTLVDEVYAHLEEVETQYLSYAEAFLAEYEECKTEAKERLQSMYDELNYPTVEYLRAGFAVDRRLIEFTVPGQGKVGSAINLLERSRAQKQWEEAAEEVTYALREQFRALVAHLAERLEPNVEGKTKRLHESAIQKVLDWIDLFKNRNVLGDEEMEQLITGAKSVLAGNPASVVRDNNALRSSLQNEMNRVTAKLDLLLVNAPARRISFEED